MLIVRNFKTLLLLVITVQIGLSLWSSSASGGEDFVFTPPSEALDANIQKQCSANETLYQSCFGINKAECAILLKDAFTACDQIAGSSELFDANSQDAKNQFSNCSVSEFSKYIEAKGVDINATCE